MMQLRWASAAFYLLTSAATASAECAWVLWNEVSRDEGEVVWIAVQAEAMKGECDLAVKGKAKVFPCTSKSIYGFSCPAGSFWTPGRRLETDRPGTP